MVKGKELVQYKIFGHFNNIIAFTTSKATLGLDQVRFTGLPANKAKLAASLSVDPGCLVFPKQTHSSCVAAIKNTSGNTLADTDALITDKAEICICVQTADCVPILLFDPERKVVAAIHAGWRGTVSKIAALTVGKMVDYYGCSPQNIMAAIGPSISPEIYEVGHEVVKVARKSIPNAEQTLQKKHSGNYHFNLWEANRQLLLNSGLISNNIEILGECSFLNAEKYFSARREGIDTGRMVSGIMLL